MICTERREVRVIDCEADFSRYEPSGWRWSVEMWNQRLRRKQ
jgi:hypothetical protein